MAVYKSNSGGWCFKFTLNGKQYMRRGFSSSSDALIAQSRMVVSGIGDFGKVLPSFKSLCFQFLDMYKESRKISTYVYVRKIFTVHIIPKIRDVRVDLLDFSDFSSWRDYFAQVKYQKKNFVLSLLKRCFSYCYDFYGYRNAFVFQLVRFTDYSIDSDFCPVVKVISFDMFKKFYDSVDSDFFRLMFLVGYFTGCRISEVRGLVGKSYKSGRLYIFQQACDKLDAGKTILISLKTKSSKRSIVLPRFLALKIESWIESNSIGEDDFIFYGRKPGFPIGENTIHRKMRECELKAGVPGFTFHAFRHTEATLLSERGLSQKVISDYLGHSSYDVTERYYVHSDNDRDKEVSSLLDTKFSSFFKT